MLVKFRLLQPKDYSLFAYWLAQPHVARWWQEPATVEFVEKEYGPSDKKTEVYITEGDGEPIGVIQSYWIKDYPEHLKKIKLEHGVGVDLFIGIYELTGKGHGTQLLSTFIDKIVRIKYPEAQYVVADPDIANIASVRVFEKAGFKKGEIVSGEHGLEQLMIFKL